MKILLIGFRGYVGSSLFNFLKTKHEIVGWDRNDNILSITKEILEKNKIEAIINCATVMDRNNPIYTPESLTYSVNIKGVENLVKQLSNNYVKLIYISTKDVYGNCYKKNAIIETEKYYKLPYYIDDDNSFSPVTAYGKSKLVGEYITECHQNHNIIRLSSCYTDYDHYRGHWLPNLIKMLKSNSDISLTNKGKQVRDLLHVNDLGELICTILKSNKSGYKINAGGGKKNIFSILQLIELFNSKSKKIMIPGDDFGFVFSNKLAYKIFGWKPEILFKDRLSLLIDNVCNGVALTF